METLLQDLRYAIRLLVKSPGFTLIAVVTLALGIGANAAIFSVVDAVLLRPLPFSQPLRVVTMAIDYGHGDIEDSVEARQYVYWRDHSQVLDSVASIYPSFGGLNISGFSGPVHVRGSKVTRQLFGAIGVEPMLGRGFTEDEDRPGGPQVVVLSYGLWRSAFGGEPHAIGRSVILNGVPSTIVGVMPPGFELPLGDPNLSNPEALVPLQLPAEAPQNGPNYGLIARLRPGVTLASAQAEANHLAADYERAHPSQDGSAPLRVVVRPFQQAILADIQIQPILLVLFGAVGFVLLIACVNVANLFLSRSTARQREIAIRTSLGATTGRLFRQLLCEGLIFSVLAGAAGLALAGWGVRILVSLSPLELPGAANFSLDWRVLLFTLAVTVLVALVCGSASSIHSLRKDLSVTLKEGSERSGSAPGRRLAGALVAGEVALSIVLLTGAGLLIATVIHLSRVPVGFNATNLLSAEMSLTAEKYSKTAAVWNFERQVVERVRQLPGVVSAATASATPLERGLNTVVFTKGAPSNDNHDMLNIEFRSVSASYFRTLSIPLVSGREFAETDSADSERVAVVNESLAGQLWPHENPIGKPLLAGEGSDKEIKPRVVVGVVSDIKEIGLDRPARATLYIPESQVADSFNEMTNYWFASTCLIHTSGPVDLGNQIRGIITSVDPEEPVSRIESMSEIRDHSIAVQRFLMTLMGIFASLALILASVGIYGVLSYQISRRTREIGIRMALGARPADVFRLVLREGMLVVFIGLAIGIAAALGLTRFLAGLLFGVQPADPIVFSLVALTLLAVALFACYIPARRATQVDPLDALRYE